MKELAGDGALRSDLAFPYRVYRPTDANHETLVLLHGSGVDETTLVPLARDIAPRAILIAVRGRIAQDGGMRWFTRITPTRFEQQSIRTEAAAFAGFIGALARQYGLDLSRTAFLGYSNGANLISSVMLLNPGLIAHAALLRAMPVLDEVPAADLSKTEVLVITGVSRYHLCAVCTVADAVLREHGAKVDARTVASGHEFGAEDADRQILAGAAGIGGSSRASAVSRYPEFADVDFRLASRNNVGQHPARPASHRPAQRSVAGVEIEVGSLVPPMIGGPSGVIGLSPHQNLPGKRRHRRGRDRRPSAPASPAALRAGADRSRISRPCRRRGCGRPAW